MLTLYQQATTFNQPPSAIFGVRNRWLAWMFDRAVLGYGKTVEHRLQEKRDGKPIYSTVEEAMGFADEDVARIKLAEARAKARQFRGGGQ